MMTLDTTFKGIPVSSAQAVIGAMTINESHDTITFCVNYRQSADHEIFNIEYFTCPYDNTGTDPITQAYAYLKTLPEFSEAVVL
ncbi:Uncharacterised protein [Klebsiella pneumoniae]|uniref:hypothetical protein n=1 Tax=Klebsiella pneumoniae complex TaxID=3390273 RepID=UPI000DE5D0C1|nr:MULTISPECIES: hypothetical protein [Klebsiella]ELN9654380.1 hypothetical protein [Klebsiella variicola]SSH66746.1 Uncharacterised protein [Klebsiella pneumoniae]SVZ66154.1 Uncharacterised protein [Klebsiella pneumoniae]SVZ95709.1 Uncharacterised protein [Klebsiella pneumoniae]SWA17655.1 Uncharacterised protein [Klebsiella pneumoniae]